MTEGQLFLPGLQPAKGWYFADKACGSYSLNNDRDYHAVPDFQHPEWCCENKPVFAAMWFRMGHYEPEDGIKKLVGFDCPFPEDTDKVYACGIEHLARIILEEDWGDISVNPEILVNARGDIMKNAHFALASKYLVEKIRPSFFTSKTYSRGRESLENFWAREKEKFF